jgi:hypothetical protein
VTLQPDNPCGANIAGCMVYRLSILLLIGSWPTAAHAAADGDYAPLVLSVLFGLVGLVCGAIGAAFLPFKKQGKLLALIPMSIVCCGVGIAIALTGLEMLQSPSRKAFEESRKPYESKKLVKVACERDDKALEHYLKTTTLMEDSETIRKVLGCTHNSPWGRTSQAEAFVLKPKGFELLARELYKLSPPPKTGGESQYCFFLRDLHSSHATPLLGALKGAGLPIACNGAENTPWVLGLLASDSWQLEPKVREEILDWLKFLKEAGIDFKPIPGLPTLHDRVVEHGGPKLVQFALENGQ